MGTPLELLKMFGPSAFFLVALSVGPPLLVIIELSKLQRRRVAQCTTMYRSVVVLHHMTRNAAEYRQECSTSYRQECSTEHVNQCKTDLQQECDTVTETKRECNTVLTDD